MGQWWWMSFCWQFKHSFVLICPDTTWDPVRVSAGLCAGRRMMASKRGCGGGVIHIKLIGSAFQPALSRKDVVPVVLAQILLPSDHNVIDPQGNCVGVHCTKTHIILWVWIGSLAVNSLERWVRWRDGTTSQFCKSIMNQTGQTWSKKLLINTRTRV